MALRSRQAIVMILGYLCLVRVRFHVGCCPPDSSGPVDFTSWNLHFHQNLVAERPTWKQTLSTPSDPSSAWNEELLEQCSGRFLGVIGQNPSVSSPTSYMLWSFGFSFLIRGIFQCLSSMRLNDLVSACYNQWYEGPYQLGPITKLLGLVPVQVGGVVYIPRWYSHGLVCRLRVDAWCFELSVPKLGWFSMST